MSRSAVTGSSATATSATSRRRRQSTSSGRGFAKRSGFGWSATCRLAPSSAAASIPGAIVALMSELGAAPVRTFSIGFQEKEYDELEYARLVAKRYETRPRRVRRPAERAGDPSHAGVALQRAVRGLVGHSDVPPLRADAPVCHGRAQRGRGRRELCGVRALSSQRPGRRFDEIPPVLRRPLDLVARMVPASGTSRSVMSRGQAFPRSARRGPRAAIRALDVPLSAAAQVRALPAEFQEVAGGDASDILLRSYAESDAPDFVDATLDVDVNNYLPDDLLVKVDIATMAHGLEATVAAAGSSV